MTGRRVGGAGNGRRFLQMILGNKQSGPRERLTPRAHSPRLDLAHMPILDLLEAGKSGERDPALGSAKYPTNHQKLTRLCT